MVSRLVQTIPGLAAVPGCLRQPLVANTTTPRRFDSDDGAPPPCTTLPTNQVCLAGSPGLGSPKGQGLEALSLRSGEDFCFWLSPRESNSQPTPPYGVALPLELGDWTETCSTTKFHRLLTGRMLHASRASRCPVFRPLLGPSATRRPLGSVRGGRPPVPGQTHPPSSSRRAHQHLSVSAARNTSFLA